MFEVVKVSKKQVAPLITATFPEYKGRKFKVEPRTSICVYNLNWFEGSRNQYRACTVAGEKAGALDKYNAKAPWDNPAEGQRVEIPAGMVLVENCMFAGKEMGLTFYVNPADMPKWIENGG